MANEVEIKFAVPDFDTVRADLQARGATCLGTMLQTDRFFDNAVRLIFAGGGALRLRQTRYLAEGGAQRDERPLLTYKGPPLASATAKIRREVQTRLDDLEAIREILQVCGMTLWLTVQKRRTSFRLGPCEIELDELPLIGRFVEIEGADELAVHAAARDLNLPGEPITRSYVRLLAEHGGEGGIAGREFLL